MILNKLGAHVSFSKNNDYLLGATKESLSWGANTMMIYLGPPQSSKRIEISNYKLDEYLKLEKTIQPIDIIVHAPYIINLANPKNNSFSKQFIVDEIKRMNYIGSKFIVLHPGNANILKKNEAIELIGQSINHILAQTNDVVISLETMSGKGNEIGSTFEEIKMIIDIVEDKTRIGVCLDTCHIWEAGYDLNDVDAVLDEFDKIIGLSKLNVIHLNDSKNDLGAKKDRHENIGMGKIGLNNLKNLFKNVRIIKIPKILETPYVDGKPIYKEEIKMLRNLENEKL